MKAVPYAVVGAAVLASWASPVVASSSQAETTEASGERRRCAAHSQELAPRLGVHEPKVLHVHGSSCPCSDCRGAEPSR